MVSLFIVLLLFGTLLPVMQQLQQSTQLKKERTVAFETMHEGAKEMQNSGLKQGQRQVDGVVYYWEMSDQLCVRYDNYKGSPQTICLE